jgi:acylphosphatase
MVPIAGERGVRVLVHGLVQGVTFRSWTVQKAMDLGLRGWVRNRRDGTVEALLWGKSDAVTVMLAALRQGPPVAQVERIEEFLAEAATDTARGFRQLPTA